MACVRECVGGLHDLVVAVLFAAPQVEVLANSALKARHWAEIFTLTGAEVELNEAGTGEGLLQRLKVVPARRGAGVSRCCPQGGYAVRGSDPLMMPDDEVLPESGPPLALGWSVKSRPRAREEGLAPLSAELSVELWSRRAEGALYTRPPGRRHHTPPPPTHTNAAAAAARLRAVQHPPPAAV